ncbi:hypothetical protein D187_010170 [Cystobacter fuscus DSM 2262]|uniref:Uncharacterized protein n=1 Tax=Cystobacter fuscus (strain ATCC 25194 / DSM 2262 / NBRC 100088 / M29) TaxID=1242864 RepID=S9PEU6_CYSF2|nr:hypothetical protein D187_010170 [Cystobacter fuscus DSM 2262]
MPRLRPASLRRPLDQTSRASDRNDKGKPFQSITSTRRRLEFPRREATPTASTPRSSRGGARPVKFLTSSSQTWCGADLPARNACQR